MTAKVAKAWFLDDEPSRRFPVYCRGNVGEIVPDVATPLTATITIPAFRTGFGELFSSTGAFTAGELADPAATGGLFGGYLYFNASFARTFAARMPGMGVGDVERQMFGAGAGLVPAHRRGPGDRSPRTLARAVAGVARTAIRGMPVDLEGDRIETEAWLAALPPAPTADQVVSAARGFTARFERHLRSLLISSMGVGVATSILERVAGRAERAEPGLLVKAMSGLGTIETAEPSVALWELGRSVAASAVLTELFDGGVDGLWGRLHASGGDDDVKGFVAAFDAFLVEHGHRGPKEVELLSETWATAPSTALTLVDRLRMTPLSADPVRAAARLAVERDDARRRLRAAVPRPVRPLVDRLLVRASTGTARREQAKGTMVRALSGLRGMVFHLADDLVVRGGLDGRMDVFMATIDELPAVARDPASYATVLADRRRRYAELNALAPPFAFEGAIPDPATWPPRGSVVATAGTDREDELVGIGAASGVARGRVRIVTDPADPRGLEPGEVLVAPLTDPAWTPLFLAAVAVVVDVGALQSHAAIVARELGIPAVVSVEGATGRLADGDLVEVDGDRGIVRRIS